MQRRNKGPGIEAAVGWFDLPSNLTARSVGACQRRSCGTGRLRGAFLTHRDSIGYIRSRAQYAAKWCVVVTVEPPKGAEGITRPDEASLSQHMAADTGCWRRTASGSVVFGLPRTTRLNEGGHGVRLAVLGSPLLYRSKAVHFCTLWTLVSIVSRCPPMTRWGRKEVAMFLLSDVTLVVLWSND